MGNLLKCSEERWLKLKGHLKARDHKRSIALWLPIEKIWIIGKMEVNCRNDNKYLGDLGTLLTRFPFF